MDHAPEKEPDVTDDEREGEAGPDAAPPAAVVGAAAALGLADLPREMPILPVRGMVVFPGTVVPLTIGREKSKRLIDSVLAGNKLLAIFTQRQEDVEDPGIDDIYRVGTVASVLKLLRMPDGTNTLMVHGIVRAGIESIVATEPYWQAIVHAHEDQSDTSVEVEALAFNARQAAEQVIELSPNVPEEALELVRSLEKPGVLADFLAANLSLGLVQRQELLETFDVADRLRKVNATLQNQLEILQLARKIQSDVRKEIDKSQRQYFLSEQLKAIRRELGEDDTPAHQAQELRERIERAGMPETVRKEADRELARLERLPQASPENGVIRDYLEWLIEMPWTRQTEDNLDLIRAEGILEADHYGLAKVKRRILEYLAVRKLNPRGKGPILCFAGPPGVGKTSLGQSIARALGRNFIRIALGGIRDEADIRGHRRTYIGAIPGRVVQELRKCGSRNPVLMLDELDKVGRDQRGDPSAALLEVLDPEQNHSFTDHYLGTPFDLSQVLFIGTVNYPDYVEPALRDRMEFIDLPGYTTGEKLQIALRYLVPRQLERNGLAGSGIAFDEDALRFIIERHTREAGVRNLERCISAVCRGLAARVARGEKPPACVTAAALDDPLGPPRFEPETAQRTTVPGVATGLAYTPVGGEIIFVEATVMPGRGGFQLTGQIGDVMRESAQAAMSLLRSRARSWKVNVDKLSRSDVHIHVPAGATPKDGPSAGLAMLTALYSLFTETAADPSVGMTGEITLRGLVLPIGGVKEKVLAAHRAGLKTVVLPARNRRDLEEVPAEVREQLRFVAVETVEEGLRITVPGRPPVGERETKRSTKPRSPRTSGAGRENARKARSKRSSGDLAARPS
jgi:ATP-dependent Lon protease